MLDNNFNRAQRDYDNQVPPECETEAFDCDECEGTGDIDGEICKKCDGNGFIELTPDEVRRLKNLAAKERDIEAKEFYDKNET